MESLQNVHAKTKRDIQYTFISNNDEFKTALRQMKSAPRLAVDIEADSLYHYFEKVCLIQISTDEETYILDPLSIGEISLLAPTMADASVEKVFHAPSYDFFCLRRDYGFEFRNIFDTHIAAQLLGHEFLGLDALMEALLSIHHSKRRQRDDWSRRPLQSEQLEYAAMDTHHLLQLRDTLEKELKKKKRLDWALEEFEKAANTQRPPREFDADGYRRIKGCRSLEPQQQAALRALYILRDRMARELDVPPFKVLNNSVLVDLVKNPPGNAKEMFHRAGVSHRIARKYSGAILTTLQKSDKDSPIVESALPRGNNKSPNRESKRRIGALKKWRNAKSGELGLPVGVVFPANLLEILAEEVPATVEELDRIPGMRRWRIHEFGSEILMALNP